MNQITILCNYKVKFKEMCKYFNIKVKEIASSNNHTIFEYKNEVLHNNNETKVELMYFIKDIYEKALLEKIAELKRKLKN